MNTYDLIISHTNKLSNLLSTDVQHGIDVLEDEFKRELLRASDKPFYYSTKSWSDNVWGAACHGTIPKDLITFKIVPLNKRKQYIHLSTAVRKSKGRLNKAQVLAQLTPNQIVESNPELHGRWWADPVYLLDLMRDLSISEPFDYQRIEDIYRWCFYQEGLPYHFTFKQLRNELDKKQQQIHYLLGTCIPAVANVREHFKSTLQNIDAHENESYTLIVSSFATLPDPKKTLFKLWINSNTIQDYQKAISQYKIINTL